MKKVFLILSILFAVLTFAGIAYSYFAQLNSTSIVAIPFILEIISIGLYRKFK